LYEGNATNPTFVALSSSKIIAPLADLNMEKFDAILYPNPTQGAATLQIKGSSKDVNVIITDMAGKVIWLIKGDNHSQINLPTEKLAAGLYTVTVKSGKDSKNLKLVKD